MKKYLILFVTIFCFISKSNGQTTELLNNGNFTNGYQNWIASQYWWVQPCNCPYNAGSSGNYAYFGLSGCDTVNSNSGYLFQDFLVPSGASNFNLSFAISVNTREVAAFTAYDTLMVQIRDQSNGIIFQLAQFTNLNGIQFGTCGPYNVFNYPMPALSGWAGQTVKVYFYASNDIAKSTVFRLDDISVEANVSCVNWVGGQPADPTLVTAAEYLCQNGVIDNNQDSNQINNTPPCKEVAYHIYNSLFEQNGYTAYSDNFPSPVVDIQSIPLEYSDAIKAMLYLDRSDGIPPLSRDYFNVGSDWGVVKGRAVRAILEAWQILPDWTGFNPNSSSPSSFLCDVALNNQYYGWMKKAFDLGFFNGLTNVCPVNCPANLCVTAQNNITIREFYILLYRVMNYYGGTPPAISNSDFFLPNSFRPGNLASNAETDRGVFSHYQKEGFSIVGGGIPLTFGHSYHSDRSEMPYMPYEFLDNNLWGQRYFPLGMSWTHNYNSYILKIPNSTANNTADFRLMIFWGNGKVESYDPTLFAYETSGVSDDFQITQFDNPNSASAVTITSPDGMKYFFDRDTTMRILRLIEIRDRNNNSQFLSYQPGFNSQTQRLQSVYDQFSGRSLNFNYQNGTNYISSVTDNVGRVLQYIVNSNTRDLTDHYDAKNNRFQYIYGISEQEKNLLKQIVKPLGNTITNTYYNRKLQSTQAGSYGIQVNWGQNYLGGGSTNSQVSVTQNGNTLTTSYVHDNRGNPTSITTPTGTVTMQYADSNNPDQPTQIVDSNTGITTTIQYEPNKKANPIFVSRSGSGNTITEQFQYNNFSQVTQYTDPDGNITQTIYDANGNITDLIKPIGSTHFNYNANKLVESIVDPLSLTTNFHYNNYGNLDSLSIAGTNISASATYDNISRITGIRNPNGIRTGFSYDNNDNLLTKRYDSLGVNYLTQNVYDANDNLITINSPTGLPTTLTYDSTDALRTETYWSFSKQWDYNQDGTIKTFRNKNSSLFNYSYLGAGDPNVGKLQSDGYANYEYYTSDKNLWKVSRGGKDIKYSYDSFSRVTDVTYTDLPGLQNDVQYVYYPNSNRLQKIDYPSLGGVSVTIEYTYDANNRLKRVKNVSNGNIYVDYTYRNDDKLLTEVFGNGTRNIYYYDNASRLDSIVTKKQNGDILAKVYCNYDPQGNHPEEFIRVYRSGPSSPPGSTAPDTAFNYVYDNMNRLADRNGASYISNPNGAVLSNYPIGYTCTWDERDNMLSFTRNGITKTFEYDGLENRRLSDSTRYLIDLMHNENVLMETNLAGDPTSVYVYGLGLVCRIDPVTNHVYYYHYDFRGSTIAITDSTESVVKSYDYSAFGKILDEQGGYSPSTKNPFTYIGKYGVMDEGNGIYFMRARYYDSNIGRFISEDPKWDINLFPYGDNNPVTKIDPNGDVAADPWSPFGQFAGLKESINQGKPLEAGLYTLALYGSVSMTALDVISLGKVTSARIAIKQSIKQRRLIGNAYRDELVKFFKENGYEVFTEVYKRTPFGGRFVDIELWKNGKLLGGIEAKVGKSRYTPSQRAKDNWLKVYESYFINVLRK